MIEVRDATLEDAGGMLAILNPIIAAGTYSSMSEPINLAAQVEYLTQFPADGVFSVAWDGERQVGLQSIEEPRDDPELGKTGEISTFVDLDRRGAGIGRALADRTLSLAAERGYRAIVARVRADNRDALAYYRAIGFAPRLPDEPCGPDVGHAIETLIHSVE